VFDGGVQPGKKGGRPFYIAIWNFIGTFHIANMLHSRQSRYQSAN
jgi:hypothetical protein